MRPRLRRAAPLVALTLAAPAAGAQSISSFGPVQAAGETSSATAFMTFLGVVKAITPGVEVLLTDLFADAPEDTYFTADATMREVSWTLRRTSFPWVFDQSFAFDVTLRGPFSAGGVTGVADYWLVHSVATESGELGIDKLVLDGFVQHMIDPDAGEHPLRPRLDWHYQLDTQTPTRVADGSCEKTASTTKGALHPGGTHQDTMDKNDVVAKVGCSGANDFLSYYQNGHAFHPEPPITGAPEPATWTLLGTGLLALGAVTRGGALRRRA